MKGTHGTCVSRANLIRQNHFCSSSAGLRGAGVYFWGYTSVSLRDYARELAISWWRFAHNKQGNYSKEKDKKCCVVYVSLNTQGLDVLDLENQEVRDTFIEYCQRVSPHIICEDDREKTSRLYDMFVDELEEKLERNFKVVHVKVQRPRKTQGILSLDITGQPSCYVVKDVSCIQVDEFEELGYE